MDQDPPPPEFTKSILAEVFPIECRLVGTESLNDICAFRPPAEDDDGGRNLSAADSVELLANGATIIALAWQLWPRRKQPPEPEVLDVEVLAAAPETARLPYDVRAAVYLAIRVRRHG